MTDDEQRAIGALEQAVFDMPYSAACNPPPLRARLDATIIEAVDHCTAMLVNIKTAYDADGTHRRNESERARRYDSLARGLRDLLGL